MRLNYLFNAIGLVLMGIGSMALLPVLVALIYHEGNSIYPFLIVGFGSIILGFLLKNIYKNTVMTDIKKSEGLGIVVISWFVFSVIASIPYLFYGLSIENAFFEGISGITSTGATILTSFDYPKTMFFWRALSQWLGGMGIIVLFVAVLPQFAVAGHQMFFAEAPGPTEDKLTPRIRNTATALWKIYIFLTVAQIVLLILCKMDPFDAICNSFATLSSGGFSINPQSILGYNSIVINWIFSIFMFFSGCSFALIYKIITKRDFTLLFKNEEFKIYFSIIVLISLLIALVSVLNVDKCSIKEITDIFFTTISTITSTGFASVDYTKWFVSAQVILFVVLFFGSCAGSTGGGIKIVRALVIFKYLKNEVIKILHPNAVTTIKVDNNIVSKEVTSQIIAFIMFYIVIFLSVAILVSIVENNVVIGLTGSIATLNIVGPGFGSVIGPMGNYDNLSAFTKFIFMFNMLIGRLELVPFLVFLNKDFWLVKK